MGLAWSWRRLTVAIASVSVATVLAVMVASTGRLGATVGHLFWDDNTNPGPIVESALSGGSPQPVAVGQNHPAGVAVNPE
jgi:hypothetical protein